jgi:hypothetical protein
MKRWQVRLSFNMIMCTKLRKAINRHKLWHHVVAVYHKPSKNTNLDFTHSVEIAFTPLHFNLRAAWSLALRFHLMQCVSDA